MFRQYGALASILITSAVFGQVSHRPTITRSPANFLADDDVVAKPVDNELSFYQQYVASDVSDEVVTSRNQIKVWNDNQLFAEQYGMDSSLAGSPFYVPTQEEKLEYFKSRYMRYLRNKSERPLKDAPKEWYKNYRASNEVDTIDELESKFRSTMTRSSAGNNLPESLQAKEVSIWKKTKFIFQPRLDQGLVIIGVKSPIAYARAWVGANGKTEFNLQQSFDSTGTRIMANYYADSGKYLSSLDQRLVENIYARVTATRDPKLENEPGNQDNTLMLLYTKQF